MVQLRDDLKGAVFAGKMFRIRFGGEKPLDRMNHDDSFFLGSLVKLTNYTSICQKVKNLTKGQFVVGNT